MATTAQQQQVWGREGADAERQWHAAQGHALAWWGRGIAWLLVVVGMTRGMRLLHDAALGQGTWLGSAALSLAVTWGLTFGGAAALYWSAQGGAQASARRNVLTAVMALGAALCFGVGAGGLWAWGLDAGAGLGARGWVGLVGAAGALARGWSLTRAHAERSHAWWVLAAGWLVAWVPASAGPVSAGAVALAVAATLWRLWRSRAMGWSLGLGCVALTLEMLRGREVTYWFMAGALCAFGALTLLDAPPAHPKGADAAASETADEALLYQSVFVNFGALLLSVIAAALCCWAMNIPLLWRGLFWPWGL